MNVGELRKALEGVEDGLDVYAESYDDHDLRIDYGLLECADVKHVVLERCEPRKEIFRLDIAVAP